jgi:protein-tyrosine phosphatase
MYIDNLVEMHSHILPAIDDGSQNIETSLKMIAKLQSQGAKKIVLTPHYYSDTISLDDFLRKRDKAYNALERALPPNSPTLIPSAEVYISKYLFNYDNLDELCIGNSGYALIEHPFSASFGESDYNRLMNLYCDYGIKPVLAHIERYRALMESKYLLDDYIEMGCLAQVNINSFDDAPRIVRKKLFKLLESNSIHFIGSDCHNLDTRPPEYEKGAKAILKKSSQEALDRLINNANQFVK